MNEDSLKVTVYDFSTDFNLIGTRNILNMDTFLIKKHDIK